MTWKQTPSDDNTSHEPLDQVIKQFSDTAIINMQAVSEFLLHSKFHDSVKIRFLKALAKPDG